MGRQASVPEGSYYDATGTVSEQGELTWIRVQRGGVGCTQHAVGGSERFDVPGLRADFFGEAQ